MPQTTEQKANALPGQMGGPYNANLPVYPVICFVLVAIPEITFTLEV